MVIIRYVNVRCTEIACLNLTSARHSVALQSWKFCYQVYNPLRSLRGGGINHALLVVGTLNVTSLMKHWPSVLQEAPSILAITETRLTVGEQVILENRFHSSGKGCVWSKPLQGEISGMTGRTGGTAVLFDKEWHILQEGLQIPLAAADTDWCAVHLWHEANRMQLLAIAYYGHPSKRHETMADLELLGRMAIQQDVSILLLGDFNLQEDDLSSCAGALQDLSHRSAVLGHEIEHTFVGPQGNSSPDRILATELIAESLSHCSLNRSTTAMNHRMLLAHISQRTTWRWMEVPGPPITLGPRCQGVDLQQSENEAAQAVAEAWLESDDLNNIYEVWSAHWESYLMKTYDGNQDKEKVRGKWPRRKRNPVSAVRPPSGTLLARLANYVNEIDEILNNVDLPADKKARFWRRMVATSKPLALKYGVPHFDLEGLEPGNVTNAILEQSKVFYRNVLQEEWRQSQQDRRIKFRLDLHEHHGVNKVVSRLLRPDEDKGFILEEGKEIVGNVAQLESSARAWRDFLRKEAPPCSTTWSATYPVLPVRPPTVLPDLSLEIFKSQIASMKAASSPGKDSWRVRELRALPDTAIEQLLFILNQMEHRQQIPEILAASWTALLEPTKKGGSPLDMRPISILSTVWRVFASAKCRQLQPWAGAVLPKQMAAYLKGRSTFDVTLRLGADIDHHMQHGIPLTVVAVDASKAFPSASRSQLAHILRRKGFPPKLLGLLLKFYECSHNTYRVLEMDRPRE